MGGMDFFNKDALVEVGSSLGNTLVYMFFIFLLISAFMFFVLIIYQYFIVYRRSAIIFERIGNTWTVKIDRIREIKGKKNGKPTMFKFLFANKLIPPIDNSLYGFKQRSPCIIFNKIGEDYTAGTVNFNSPINIDLTHEFKTRMMFIQENEEIERKFDLKGFIQQNLPIILNVGMLFVWSFIIIITLKWSGESLSAAGGVLESTSDKVVEAIKAAKPQG